MHYLNHSVVMKAFFDLAKLVSTSMFVSIQSSHTLAMLNRACVIPSPTHTKYFMSCLEPQTQLGTRLWCTYT